MYLIVGANGYVGSYVIKNVLSKTKDKVMAADMSVENNKSSARVTWVKCDITKHEDIQNLNELCKKEKTCKVVYLAAYHLPDQVRANPKLAWHINITSLSDFLNTFEHVSSFFYSSTEMVYSPGNLNIKFTEDAEKQPVNAYGKNKIIAETLVKGYGYNLVRFPFLIGPSILKHKKHFYDVIVETIKSGKPIEMFKDAYKTALDFDTVGDTLVELSENYSEDMPKAMNLSGDEVLSKYEIGLRIADKYECARELIVPISLNDDNKIFVEKRADCTLLDNTLIKSVLGVKELKLKL